MPTATKFWSMATNKAANSAEISIYGIIGSSWWDESISAAQFSRDLKALGSDIKDITLRLNSQGGSVFDGLAIRSTLKSHPANVHVIVDGIAASIATIIAMAGDKITMAAGSMWMVHNPMNSLSQGNASEFREMADFLDKIRDNLVSVYHARTNIPKDELIALLDEETFMTAEEALEKGFIDEIETNSSVTAMMRGAVAVINGVDMDFTRFKNPPILPKAQAEPRQWPTNTAKQSPPGGATLLNLEELKNQHPALYEQLRNETLTAERARMKDLDNLATSGPGVTALIEKAKYETFDSAANAALSILELQNKRRQDAGKARNEDAKDSGVDDVESSKEDVEDLGSEKDKDKKQIEATGSKLAGAINRLRGGVK